MVYGVTTSLPRRLYWAGPVIVNAEVARLVIAILPVLVAECYQKCRYLRWDDSLL
jgi:hypothetical protein